MSESTAIDDASRDPYARTLLVADPDREILVMRWVANAWCAPHDHGEAGGHVHVLEGALVERRYRFDGANLEPISERHVVAPAILEVGPGEIHDMRAIGTTTTVHVYRPRVLGMRVYDLARRETLVVSDDCGAWVPRDASLVRAREAWSSTPTTLPPA